MQAVRCLARDHNESGNISTLIVINVWHFAAWQPLGPLGFLSVGTAYNPPPGLRIVEIAAKVIR